MYHALELSVYTDITKKAPEKSNTVRFELGPHGQNADVLINRQRTIYIWLSFSRQMSTPISFLDW